MVSDTSRAAAVSESIRLQRIQSVMCAPLKSPEKSYGAIYVDLRVRGVSYQPEDLEFFAAVCAHVAVNVENLRLYHRQLEAFRQLSQAQDQLIAAEKMGVLGRLAGSIAHELNNPLQGIMFAATFLSEDLQESGGSVDRFKMLERVDTVLHSVDRCAQLVKRLLHYSRRDPSVLVPLVISGPIEQAIQLMSYLVVKKGVTVQARYPEDSPKILGNASELEQVFINLIKNAADAISPPGEIDLTVREADGLLEVAVTDTGIGIDPGDLPHIFEELFTTKAPGEGTGLGLPLCKRIVEKHGGDISVVSKPGEGTTFTLFFPVWRGGRG
jgi:two-component system NtrC family sensor kinase